MTGIVPRSLQETKLTRAEAAAPELETGNYWLPQTQWAEEFIEECVAFPKPVHDDMVEAWSQAASRFRTSTSEIVDYYQGEAETATPVAQQSHRESRISDPVER